MIISIVCSKAVDYNLNRKPRNSSQAVHIFRHSNKMFLLEPCHHLHALKREKRLDLILFVFSKSLRNVFFQV